MARLLTCDIVTPEEKVCGAEATLVSLPGIEGEMGVLPQHMPLMTPLGSGEVRVTFEDESKKYYAISGGYAQIRPDDHVIVLADNAIDVEDIDLEQVEGAIGSLAYKIDKLEQNDESSGKSALEARLHWAKVQKEIAERHR